MSNRRGNPNWQAGTSGNPKGRPAKARALTTLLEAAGNKTVTVAGKRISGKHQVAALAWEGAATGIVTFPDGITRHLDLDEWLALVKWIYSQVDGPPKAELDLTSNGAALLPPRPPGLATLTTDELLTLEALVAKAAQPSSD